MSLPSIYLQCVESEDWELAACFTRTVGCFSPPTRMESHSQFFGMLKPTGNTCCWLDKCTSSAAEKETKTRSAIYGEEQMWLYMIYTKWRQVNQRLSSVHDTLQVNTLPVWQFCISFSHSLWLSVLHLLLLNYASPPNSFSALLAWSHGRA